MQRNQCCVCHHSLQIQAIDLTYQADLPPRQHLRSPPTPQWKAHGTANPCLSQMPYLQFLVWGWIIQFTIIRLEHEWTTHSRQITIQVSRAEQLTATHCSFYLDLLIINHTTSSQTLCTRLWLYITIGISISQEWSLTPPTSHIPPPPSHSGKLSG